jgi:hypothetical protein
VNASARHAIAEVLDHVDVLQRGQRLLAALREDDLLLRARGAGGRARSARKGARRASFTRGAPAGSAPPATASIARSIGDVDDALFAVDPAVSR